jgi:hypothetical protein
VQYDEKNTQRDFEIINHDNRKVINQQEHIARLEEHTKELSATLQAQTLASEHQIAKLQQEIDELNHRLQVSQVNLVDKDQEIHKLMHWLFALNEDIASVFKSLTWRTGDIFTNIILKILFRKKEATAQDHIREIMQEVTKYQLPSQVKSPTISENSNYHDFKPRVLNLPNARACKVKKLVVFANCQSGALVRTMMENKEFSSQYKWDFLRPVQILQEIHIAEVVNKVKNADLFIYQPVAASPNRPYELNSKFLLEQIKDDAETISFPSIYFDGYFPHLQTLKGKVSVLNLVHDYFMAYSYAIGLSEEETIELINKENLYSKSLSIQLVGNSLKNLRDREKESNIDIKLCDFIEKNYKKVKLFNQFNHPKREVFKYIAESILNKIGIDEFLVADAGASHLDEIMTPIYRSTHKNLNLQFKEDFETYGAIGHQKIKQREVIYKFFEFYRKDDLEDIKMSVSKTKPFVAKIIHANI